MSASEPTEPTGEEPTGGEPTGGDPAGAAGGEPTPTIPLTGEPRDPDAQPPPAATTPTSLGDYRDNLPDGLGSHPVFEKLDSVEKLAREHANLQKVLGGPKMARPAENWGKDEWDRFYTELGRPPRADQYDFSEVPIPEHVVIDEEWRDGMVAKMHGLGLTQAQVSGVMESYFDSVGERLSGMEGESSQVRESGLAELQEEFGRAMNEKIAQAGRAFRELAGERYKEVASIELADGRVLGDHPEVIRMMAKVGSMDAEHKMFGEDRVGGSHTMTPHEAGAEERRLRGDKGFREKLLNKNHAEHQDAVDRISQLVQMQVPEDEMVIP